MLTRLPPTCKPFRLLSSRFTWRWLFFRRLTLLLLTLLLCHGCSQRSQPTLEIGEEANVPSHSFTFTPPQFEHLSSYKLNPGDVLDVLFQIQTWAPESAYRISLGDTVSVRFPEISQLDQNQKVLPDGSISLPYIGVVNIYDKTAAEVAAALNAAYKEILVSPNIYVTVPEYLSQIRELKKDLHTSARGLSRLVTVRPDGFVTFPMVGDVFVVTRSIPEIKAQLNQAYNKISASLHADLFLERHAGSKIYIGGEVTKPGAYDISRPISIIQAVTMAEGLTRDALLNQVYVIRRQQQQMIATRIDMRDTLDFTATTRLFYLLPDDIVYIASTELSDAAHIARQVADVLFFRGWSMGFSWQLRRDTSATDTIIEAGP